MNVLRFFEKKNIQSCGWELTSLSFYYSICSLFQQCLLEGGLQHFLIHFLCFICSHDWYSDRAVCMCHTDCEEVCEAYIAVSSFHICFILIANCFWLCTDLKMRWACLKSQFDLKNHFLLYRALTDSDSMSDSRFVTKSTAMLCTIIFLNAFFSEVFWDCTEATLFDTWAVFNCIIVLIAVETLSDFAVDVKELTVMQFTVVQ